MKKFLLTFATVCTIFASCSSDEPTVNPADDPTNGDTDTPTEVKPLPVLSVAESKTASAQGAFAMNFFQTVNKDYTGKNVITSPMSASLLLSMLANTADDVTARQITEALGCTDMSAANSLSKKYMEWFPGADDGINLQAANSVWYKQQYTIAPEFASIASEYYSAEAFARDFGNKTDLIDEINSWTSKKTNGIIDKILQNIPDKLEAVQVNALYFKGAWQSQFSEKSTTKETFHTPATTKVVEMMKSTRNFKYAETQSYQAIELPYGKMGNCSMTIVLPAEGTDIDAFVASETFANFSGENMKSDYVDLTIPKFSLKTEKEIYLNKVLADLGITNLGNLQKCNIFTEKIESMFDVFQKAGISVDEKGTEAAAATWSGMIESPGDIEKPEPKAMNINRPFVFLIKENIGGMYLFAGKVLDI